MSIFCGFGDDGSCHPWREQRNSSWVNDLPGFCQRSACNKNQYEGDQSRDTVRLGKKEVAMLMADAEKFLSPPRAPPAALSLQVAHSADEVIPEGIVSPEIFPLPPPPCREPDIGAGAAVFLNDTSASSESSPETEHRLGSIRETEEDSNFDSNTGGPPPTAGSAPFAAVTEGYAERSSRRSGSAKKVRSRTNAISMPDQDGRRVMPMAARSSSSPRASSVPAEAAQAGAQSEHQATLDREQLRQVQDAKEWVSFFLQRHGYVGVNEKRSRMFKSKYPLHTAVKLGGNADGVRLLLWAMADPSLQNSAGLTPLQLAERNNAPGPAGGSHDQIIQALTCANMASAAARRRACGGA